MAGQTEATLFPDGSVSFCEITKPVGSLRDFGYSMRKLWKSEPAVQMRRLISACACTHDCLVRAHVHMATRMRLLHTGAFHPYEV